MNFEDDIKDIYSYVNLEDIQKGFCECAEDTAPLDPEEENATSKPNPLEEFLERMALKFSEETVDVEGAELLNEEINGIGGCISKERICAVSLWLTECARRQEGMVGPRNLRHFLCPNLDGNPLYKNDADTDC
ncbi:uncharacterized protein LOC107266724 [Cephus cinctus]|uniref:Uncharacterized protein LOC107266724 n=1 Tax=Cephus cinctus TaxID=211228 RepID=A0AAJ7W0A0_CEPCN|nr:uncharacterized protein LOC107266724 [Cephus cinctus]